MFQHWRIEPPVGVLFGHFVGFEPPETSGKPKRLSGEELRRQAQELMAMFGGGTVR